MNFLKNIGGFLGGVFSWLGKMIVNIFSSIISETEKELKTLSPSDAALLVKLCREAASHVAKNVTSDKWQDKLDAGYSYVNGGLRNAGMVGVGTHLIIKLLIAAVSDLRLGK